MLEWSLRPEVFSFSPLPRWYGLLFASGFAVGFFIMRWMVKREGKPLEMLDSLLMHIVLGTVIGMRLGHCLLYQPDVYLHDPLRILKVWEGGFASHGGFLGVLIALALFARRHGESFFWVADRICVPSMFAAGAIRLGNFFNSEMFGHPTDVPWAVTFTLVDNVPRHPTQLYEAFGYFAVCAIGLLAYARTRIAERPGRLLGLVMALGFAWRTFVEHFKEDQVAFEQGMALNMGQLLSLPYVVCGLLLLFGVQDRLLRRRAG